MRFLLAQENLTSYGWLNRLINAVLDFVNPVLIVASVAGIIYAIWVGIKFVKADDKTAREEAKSKLIMVIVGIVVVILLIALFYFLAFNIQSILDQTKIA